MVRMTQTEVLVPLLVRCPPRRHLSLLQFIPNPWYRILSKPWDNSHRRFNSSPSPYHHHSSSNLICIFQGKTRFRTRWVSLCNIVMPPVGCKNSEEVTYLHNATIPCPQNMYESDDVPINKNPRKYKAHQYPRVVSLFVSSALCRLVVQLKVPDEDPFLRLHSIKILKSNI